MNTEMPKTYEERRALIDKMHADFLEQTARFERMKREHEFRAREIQRITNLAIEALNAPIYAFIAELRAMK